MAAATLAGSYHAFALYSKGIAEDFALAREGRLLGELFNALPDEPAPDIGVLPAGGIAVSYRGRVVDLLGLNWAEMAHASGRRRGIPGHCGFDPAVFWKHTALDWALFRPAPGAAAP